MSSERFAAWKFLDGVRVSNATGITTSDVAIFHFARVKRNVGEHLATGRSVVKALLCTGGPLRASTILCGANTLNTCTLRLCTWCSGLLIEGGLVYF